MPGISGHFSSNSNISYFRAELIAEIMDIDFLVIEGNIGAGKTTLAKMLSEDYNSKLILEEFTDNPFLPKFYHEPSRFSFPLELSFLAERYNQLKKDLANRDLFRNLTITDYYFMKSLIFAQNTLAPDEYNLYRRLFDIIHEKFPKPDLYVYLHLPVELLMSNIKKRGLEYEQQIDADYLKVIQGGYFNFFSQQTEFPIVVIDISNIDFVDNQDDYKKIKELIFGEEFPNGLSRLIL
jgi:deoxyguanosine kinase